MHSCPKNVLLLSMLLPHVVLVSLHVIFPTFSIPFLNQVRSPIAKTRSIPRTFYVSQLE